MWREQICTRVSRSQVLFGSQVLVQPCRGEGWCHWCSRMCGDVSGGHTSWSCITSTGGRKSLLGGCPPIRTMKLTSNVAGLPCRPSATATQTGWTGNFCLCCIPFQVRQLSLKPFRSLGCKVNCFLQSPCVDPAGVTQQAIWRQQHKTSSAVMRQLVKIITVSLAPEKG